MYRASGIGKGIEIKPGIYFRASFEKTVGRRPVTIRHSENHFRSKITTVTN
jgi:hypothetical protein